MPAFELLIPSNLPHDEFRRRVCLAAIKARYGSVQVFAKEIGATRQQVSNVIGGKYRGGRVAVALCELTGIPLRILFPVREKAA